MAVIIGIDIGTTEIKMSVEEDDRVIDYRERSPQSEYVILNNTVNRERVFYPLEVWKKVKELLGRYAKDKIIDDAIISIVAHAPSYCVWNSSNVSIGVPYLAYYGDSRLNNKLQRTHKSIRREQLLKSVCLTENYNYISGLTGYIVYQLTGFNTLDSVTAWEIGIECQNDYYEWGKRVNAFLLPSIYSPITRFPIKKGIIDHLSGEVVVGTTDTGVLPLTVAPEFCDYYVYLGTWGSLLRTKINEYSVYSETFFEGNLHEWILSVPNFEKKIDANQKELNFFFKQLDINTPANCRIAICGGLTKKYATLIKELVSIFLCGREIKTVPVTNNAIGAIRLGKLSKEETYHV